MNAQTIDTLVAALGEYPGSVSPVYLRDAADVPEEDVNRFALLYSKPDTGWYLAKRYAENGRFFPTVLYGDDHWVVAAWHMLRDPVRFYNRHVDEAKSLKFDPARRHHRGILEAILTARDGGPKEASRRLGFDVRSMTAYQALFFNIADRREDHAYLQHVVYPQGRLVEMLEGYFENATFADLMIRAGFNHGLDDILYLSGLEAGNTTLSRVTSRPDVAEKLEKLMMGVGYVMGRNGLINQRRHSSVVSRSVTLLASAKQSGAQTKGGSPFELVKDAFRAQFSAFEESERASYQEAFADMHREDDIVESVQV